MVTPRRVMALLAVVVALILVTYAHVVARPAAPSGAHTPTGSTPTASAPTPVPNVHRVPTSRPVSIKDVTRRYVTAFFSKGGTDAAWHQRIIRYATDDLALALDGTDRAEVPSGRVVGVRVTGWKPTYAETRARLNTGMVLHVALVHDGGRWKVTEFAPVNQAGVA